MKKVKLIYFPVMVLLIIALAVASFMHFSDAGSANGVSSAYVTSVTQRTTTLVEKRNASESLTSQDTASEIRASIISSLSGMKPAGWPIAAWTALSASGRIKYDEDGKDTGETYTIRHYRTNQETYPWYIQQKETITFDTLSKMGTTLSEEEMYLSAGKEINNIVVTVPGAKSRAGDRTADAMLVVAHIDPSKKSPGSEDAANTVMIAAFLEEIERLVTNGEYYENDVVFLFADSRYDSSFGVYAFLNQFVGMRKSSIDTNAEDAAMYDLTNRIKFAVNFDSMGTGTSSMLVAASENNDKLVAEYADMMGGSLSSSYISQLFADYQSNFDAFEGINSYNFVTFGNLENNNSIGDTVDYLGEAHIRELAAKKGTMLSSVLKTFGDADLNSYEGSKDVVYFSVLGLFTVTYTKSVSYALSAVALVLFALAICLNLLKRKSEKAATDAGEPSKESGKKPFSLRAMLRGIVLQVFVMAAAIASVFVIYFIMGAILSGFGVFTFQSITTFTHYNVGLIIGFTLLLAGMMGLFYNLFKKPFNLKATDTVRGGATLFILTAAVLGFVCPALAYVVLIPAIFVAAVMLCTVLVKDAFRRKTSQDIERLMLYLIPTLVALPLMLPIVAMLASLYPIMLMPIVLLPVIMLLSMITPYLTALKPHLAKVMAKLPQHTVKVKKLVTEDIEDSAKKGKFTTVTHYVITKEKVNWKYRHGVLMTLIACVAAVVIMISASVTLPVGASTYGMQYDYQNHITSTLFDDSFILSWKHSGEGNVSATTMLEIHDQAMYKELRYALNGYEWDSDTGAFTKSVSTSAIGVPTISPLSGGKKFTVKPALNGAVSGISEVTIHNASTIESLKVLDEGDDIILKATNASLKDTITIKLPLNADDIFTFDITYLSSAPEATNVYLTFKQFVWCLPTSLNSLKDVSKDFELVRDYFDSEARTVRFGIYYERDLSLTYQA